MPENSQRSPVKSYFRSLFDIRGWVDWDRFRATSNYFLNIFRRLFILKPADPTQIKTFEQVMEEKEITEEMLQKQVKGLKRLYITMLVLAGCFYGYGMYELLYGDFLSLMLSLVFMFVVLALAFRYHFWSFQIRSRKLGCTFSEWFNATFGKQDAT